MFSFLLNNCNIYKLCIVYGAYIYHGWAIRFFFFIHILYISLLVSGRLPPALCIQCMMYA